MIILIILIIILALYFYGKRIAHNASVKGLPYTPAKQLVNTSQIKARAPSLSPPPFPPPIPKENNILLRDDEVSTHPIFSDYLISYCDRNGNSTERRITIQKLEGDLFFAYCHLRHDRRSFYISSVSKWINCDSGEVISDIFEDLKKARINSVYGVVDRMFEDLYPVMGTLLYLCKGDKRLMIEERNILIKVFQELCGDPRLTDEIINKGINEMAVPSRTKYKNLVKELSAMNDIIKSIVLNASKDIFASRKKLNPIEEEALSELSKRLTEKR